MISTMSGKTYERYTFPHHLSRIFSKSRLEIDFFALTFFSGKFDVKMQNLEFSGDDLMHMLVKTTAAWRQLIGKVISDSILIFKPHLQSWYGSHETWKHQEDSRLHNAV